MVKIIVINSIKGNIFLLKSFDVIRKITMQIVKVIHPPMDLVKMSVSKVIAIQKMLRKNGRYFRCEFISSDVFPRQRIITIIR
jgi:UDP-N-acetylglucosamine pyrophosphorylase